MKRTIFCSVILMFLLVSSVTWGGNAPTEPNAKLVQYSYKPLIIPNNAGDYQYLFKHPLTGLLFVTDVTEDRLSKLTVKDLKYGSLGRIGSKVILLKFDKIVGFEDTARELKAIDEFEIEARKKEIVSKLIDCHRRYKAEQRKYLAGFGGTYRFVIGKFVDNDFSDKYRLMMDYCPGDREGCIGSGLFKSDRLWSSEEVRRADYDFDRKLLKTTLLAPASQNQNGWETSYISRYRQKYGDNHWKQIGQNLFFGKIAISIEDAKRLFGGEGKTYCQTILEVKPREGSDSNNASEFFDIVKVTKLYYRGTVDGEPVLGIDVVSDRNHPLY